MNIGIDARSLLDKEYSGVSEFTKQLTLNLLKLDKKNNYKLFYNKFFNKAEVFSEFKGDNVEIINTGYPNKAFNYIMQKNLKYPKIDQALAVDLFFMPHINFISLSGKCKKVLTVHDLSFVRYKEFFSVKKNIWHFMVNIGKLLGEADSVVTVSENTKNDIIQLFGIKEEKVNVIYSGIEMSVDEIRENDAKKTRDKFFLKNKFIFFLATMEPRKNIVGIVKAFDEYVEKHRVNNLDLVIAGGKGWKNKEIFKAIECSKYKSNIKHLGYLSKKEKNVLYKEAELFIYPSFYEGFGFPPLEAVKYGTLSIISNSSSLPEVLKSGSIMVDPFNINEISEAINLGLNDNRLRRNLTEKGKMELNKFDWRKTAQGYLEIFDKLIDN